MSATPTDLPLSERQPPNYELLARMVVREGKSFKESALAAGYSASVAAAGLKKLVGHSAPAAEAIKRESDRFISLDKLKPLAVQRLHAEITNPRSSMGMKAIELAGRFKETDWFVRNSEVQVGIAVALGENNAPEVNAIEAYQEE